MQSANWPVEIRNEKSTKLGYVDGVDCHAQHAVLVGRSIFPNRFGGLKNSLFLRNLRNRIKTKLVCEEDMYKVRTAKFDQTIL